MRATACSLILGLALASSPASALRVFVAPVPDADAETARTLSRAVEDAVQDALPRAVVVTAPALETLVEVNFARDCLAEDGAGACMTELADALDVDYIARPQLGRLGGELVLSLALVDGREAVVLAQGQRAVDAAHPGELLDVLPDLAREVVRDAGLSDRSGRPIPAVPIAVGVGGGVLGAVGAAALLWRGNLAAEYADGRLDRSAAQAFESTEQALLWGGIGAAVVGGAAALVGVGVAVWSLVASE